jgi:polyphosphate glucokinase
MDILGIDIGGSGIKGALVTPGATQFATERFRVETPVGEGPRAFLDALLGVVDHFEWRGPVGLAFPGVIRGQTIRTAANLDKELIGLELARTVAGHTGGPAWCTNDADAAGLAEARLGAGRGVPGVVMLITVGTGLGTALLVDGHLVPNTEFGHLRMHNKGKGKWEVVEKFAAASARDRENLGWSDWAKRFSKYLAYLHELTWPSRFIIGGGVSKKGEKWLKHIESETEVVTAELENKAGIIGAAIAARENLDLP